MGLRLFGYSFAGLVAALSLAVYYFIADGRLPNTPAFELDLETLRDVASDTNEPLPHAIDVEVLARDDIPTFATHAGLDFSSRQMIRTAFLVKSDTHQTLIDIGMDRYVSRKFESGKEFYDDAFGRINKAIAESDAIAVTHEHPDHIGYLARYPELAAISQKLKLTQEQVAGTAIYAQSESIPDELRRVDTVSSTDLTLIAPGIVMIPAPGHTPGSVMFYVQTRDQTEIIFVGDVVWNISNVTNRSGRPRLVQNFLMQTPESRSLVYQQVAALVQLKETNPQIVLIPSHDEQHLDGLIEQGLIHRNFR